MQVWRPAFHHDREQSQRSRLYAYVSFVANYPRYVNKGFFSANVIERLSIVRAASIFYLFVYKLSE